MRTILAPALVLVITACGSDPGPGSTPRAPSPPPPPRPGVPPPSDETGIRKLLVGEVTDGGLWFADAACQTQFGRPTKIQPAEFDAFAHCIAALHLRASGRGDAFDDTSVLTDDNGFELEARVVASRLDYIGFSGRAPGFPDLPTITPETLESLRSAGDPHATISDADAKRIRGPEKPNAPLTQPLRLCLADNGDVTSVMPGAATSVEAANAFSAVARTWKFRPFTAGGQPLAACAIVALHYPAIARDADADRLPQPPHLSKAGHVVYNVSPLALDALRIAGRTMIKPDDPDRVRIHARVVGSFKLCVDETGHYESGTLLLSTGFPMYDAKIARELMHWVFQPYVEAGVAIPVCTAYTFIYTEN